MGWLCSPQLSRAAQGGYHHQKITTTCFKLPVFSPALHHHLQLGAPRRDLLWRSVPGALPGLQMCQDRPKPRDRGDSAAARSLLLSHHPCCRRRSNAEQKGSDLDASQKLKFSLVGRKQKQRQASGDGFYSRKMVLRRSFKEKKKKHTCDININRLFQRFTLEGDDHRNVTQQLQIRSGD